MVRSKILPAWGILFCAMTFLFGCAAPEHRPPSPPLSDQEAARIARRILKEGQQVSSFYSIGMVSAGEWYGESDADILVAGVRKPFRIKLEITHTWGQPLLHILIDGTKVKALSFRESKFYQGTFTSRALSRLIPVRFDPDLIWGILRGYPSILPHESVQSLGPNQISLLNGKREEVEIIDLDGGKALPRHVTFPDRNIRVTYGAFHREGGIPYAGSVKVSRLDGGKRLTLNHRRMVLNGNIPNGVFAIPRPPAMKIIDLDRAGMEEPH
jgi:hypothetical protein